MHYDIWIINRIKLCPCRWLRWKFPDFIYEIAFLSVNYVLLLNTIQFFLRSSKPKKRFVQVLKLVIYTSCDLMLVHKLSFIEIFVIIAIKRKTEILEESSTSQLTEGDVCCPNYSLHLFSNVVHRLTALKLLHNTSFWF